MAPAPEGLPLVPRSQFPTDSAHRSTPAVTRCGGDLPERNGDTPGPHASKHRALEQGRCKKKAPRQQPELCPLLLESSRFPPPHWAAGMQAQVRGVRVLEPDSGSFSPGSHTCPCEKEAAFPPAGEPVKTLGALHFSQLFSVTG